MTTTLPQLQAELYCLQLHAKIELDVWQKRDKNVQHCFILPSFQFIKYQSNRTSGILRMLTICKRIMRANLIHVKKPTEPAVRHTIDELPTSQRRAALPPQR